MAALDPERYELVPVGIDRSGTWAIAHEATELLARSGADAPISLPTGGTAIEPQLALQSDAPSTTVVIPVLHGPNGEDGTIQGLLELADVAYVGAGVLGSALAMDKSKAKEVLAANGVAQARFRSAAEWEIDDDLLAEIAADLGFPIFVKPANMGSSVGVSKAVDAPGLAVAVAHALRFDERLVFEETVVGREIEIGVLGNNQPRCSVPGEIVPGADFYDYDDKYVDGSAKLVIPADLSADEIAALERLALRAYSALRAEVLARVDVFYEEGGRGFLLNEINTFPGFTPISMFPRMWQATGLSYSALLDEMIRLALERHARRRRVADAGRAPPT